MVILDDYVRYTIQLELTGGSVAATVVLWNFDPIAMGSETGELYNYGTTVQLYVTHPNHSGVKYADFYEFEFNRPPQSWIFAGYYRFAVDVFDERIWTDWYYLTNSIYYSNGVRSGD